MKARSRQSSTCALHIQVVEAQQNNEGSILKDHDKKYSTKVILGRGGLGSVFHVECLQVPKTFYAKKTVMLTSSDIKHRIQRECSILQKLTDCLNSKGNSYRRPPTVKLHDVIHYPECTSLVITFAPLGDLGTYLQYKPAVPLATMTFFATELIVALEFLHHEKILHRDIKPENVLLDHRRHLLLTDFDLSIDMSKDTGELTNRCGTFEFMAPEVANTSVAYSFPADIFSLGMTLLSTMAEGDTFRCSTPHGNLTPEQLESLALRGKYHLAGPANKSGDCRRLLQRMLACNTEKRATLDQLKKETFFAGVNWFSVEKGENKVPSY